MHQVKKTEPPGTKEDILYVMGGSREKLEQKKEKLRYKCKSIFITYSAKIFHSKTPLNIKIIL